MKKVLLIIFVTLFSTLGFSQRGKNAVPNSPTAQSMKAGNFIDVNAAGYPESNYSITQLITDVLISGGTSCGGAVSNVIVSPNLAVSSLNRSWGYFNKGTTAFPFDEGVLLMTGPARNGGNSFIPDQLGTGTTGTLGTGGDADLASAIGVSNSSLYDATYIQFDFVPVTNEVTFNYIFASEEYTSNYPCTYSDGFALLLKPVTAANYTNLAVLPAGGGSVSVTNIHDYISASCPAINSQYYAGNNTANIETNFNGRTVPLTATATVIPGTTYRFKMVIADYNDNSYDTGVFLQAGSFNIGTQLTGSNGNPLPASVDICQGESFVINANAQVPGATFQWYLGTNPIAGATSNTYTATQSGYHSVEVTLPGSGSGCSETVGVNVNVNPLPIVQDTSLNVCSSSSTANFDLTSAQATISTDPGITFNFYANLTDAQAGNTNTIANPTNYNSANATVYVLVTNANGCKDIAELQLIVEPTPATPTITASASQICQGGSVTLTSSSATGNTWSTGETTQTITVSAAGTYTLTVTDGNCTSSAASITVTQEQNPNLQISGNTAFCDGNSTTLTASATGTGITYSWSTGQNTPSITVTTAGTYTVTATTTSGCTYQESAIVTVDTPPNAQNASLSECSSNTTANFDLTSAETSMTALTTATFAYYVNQTDANAGNANTIATPTSYNSGNATVYVRVSNGTCWQVVELQLSVVSIANPVITASANSICAGTPVTLSSNFTSGNTWSTGETTQNITVAAAGTYSLTVTNGNCPSTPVSIIITDTPDPNVTISGNLTLCSPPSTTLTASANGTGNTFAWSNGTNGATNTVSAPGTYTVTVTTPSGCTFQESATVVQGNVPVAQNTSLSECSLTNDYTFDLTTAESSISTSSGVTFTYYENLADAQAGNANFIATPTSYNTTGTTIYVLVDNGTCSVIAELFLEVVVTPSPVITQSAPAICAGTPVTLTSNYPTGNTWSNGATTQSITVSTAGTYTLTVANGSCVGSPVSVTLVSTPDPNVQITGGLTFCQGSFTTLTASANGTGNTFTWSNGSNGTTINVNTAGNYTVTVTTPSGCQFQESVTVTQEPTIDINIVQPNQITCNETSVTIDASASTFQSNVTILWTAGLGGNIVSGSDTLTPIVDQGGTYTLTITNTTGLNCSQTQTVTVIENNLPPMVNITAPQMTICAGDPLVLTANGAHTYTWDGLTGSGNTQTVSPTTTTTYTVIGTGLNGCVSDPASITIIVVPAIESTLEDIQFCKGETGILDAGYNPNYTYLWSNGETTQTISVTDEGIYTVTIDNGICTKTFSATVSYTPTPAIEEVIYEDNSLTIIVQQPVTPNLEYSIDGGVSWQTSNVFYNIKRNLNYTIYIRVIGYSCFSATDYYTFFVPNSITPNFDGVNDYIDFTAVSNYENFTAEIYDRYGKAVFRATNNDAIWRGTFMNNTKAPTATYWYQVSWTDPISKKLIQKDGWILLKNRD